MHWLWLVISNVALASLLALAAWFVQRQLRQPAVAHVLWVLVLVKLVTPPLWSVPVQALPAPLACTLGACGCQRHSSTHAPLRAAIPWVLLALWATGAAATGLIAYCRWRRIHRLMLHASPASAGWQALATDLAHRLSVRRAPELIVVPGRLPPLVAPGRGGPRVLLPVDWIDRLTAAQREVLLLHELTHIARRDHLVRLLELLVSVMYWWLPPLRWIGRSLRACEEACCDESVVAHMPGARREYAGLLLDVLDFASPVWASPLSRQPDTPATAMSAATDLEHRLRAILHHPTTTRRTWPAVTIAGAVALAILPCQLRHEVPRLPAAPTAANHPATADPTGIEAAGEVCEPMRLAVLCCPS